MKQRFWIRIMATILLVVISLNGTSSSAQKLSSTMDCVQAPEGKALFPTNEKGVRILNFGIRGTDNIGKAWKKHGKVFRYISAEIMKKTCHNEKVVVKIVVSDDDKNYGDAQKLLSEGPAHIGRYGPASYVKVHAAYPEIEILAVEHSGDAENPNHFKGYFIAQAGQEVDFSAEGLRGKKIAFGDPDSTLGTVLASQSLLNLGMCWDDAEISHKDDHSGVMKAVLAGEAFVGALKGSLVEENLPHGKIQIVHTMLNVEKPWVVNTQVLSPVAVKLLREILLDPTIKKRTGRSFIFRDDIFYNETRRVMEMPKIFKQPNCQSIPRPE